MRLQMLGPHQLDNAAAAVAAASVLRGQGLGHISQDSIVQGLQQTKLPGRLQVRQACLQCTCCCLCTKPGSTVAVIWDVANLVKHGAGKPASDTGHMVLDCCPWLA